MAPELKKFEPGGGTRGPAYAYREEGTALYYYPHAGSPLNFRAEEDLSHRISEASKALQVPEVEIRKTIENGETVEW
jgi:hypothetical protein